MLDCPLANHTSPTRTFHISSVLVAPATVRTRFSLDAGMGSSVTRQAPFASAVADLVCPANVTVTVSPASAVPHTGTARSRCRTMFSANGVAVATFASAAHADMAAATARSTFVEV